MRLLGKWKTLYPLLLSPWPPKLRGENLWWTAITHEDTRRFSHVKSFTKSQSHMTQYRKSWELSWQMENDPKKLLQDLLPPIMTTDWWLVVQSYHLKAHDPFIKSSWGHVRNNICMYVCVCTYICMCVYVYIYIYIYTHTCERPLATNFREMMLKIGKNCCSKFITTWNS